MYTKAIRLIIKFFLLSFSHVAAMSSPKRILTKLSFGRSEKRDHVTYFQLRVDSRRGTRLFTVLYFSVRSTRSYVALRTGVTVLRFAVEREARGDSRAAVLGSKENTNPSRVTRSLALAPARLKAQKNYTCSTGWIARELRNGRHLCLYCECNLERGRQSTEVAGVGESFTHITHITALNTHVPTPPPPPAPPPRLGGLSSSLQVALAI